MKREQKAAVIDEIAEELGASQAVFAVDYRGISVPQAAELRARLRDADASFRIVKNTLTERAADKAGAEDLKALLEGPTALTFVHGDAAVAAKAIADFARAEQVLDWKGGVMDGVAVSVDELRAIARLPAREVLHAQLVGTIAAPITGLVRGLNGLIAGIASQLRQIEEQGLVGGDAPAEAPAAEPEAPAAEAPAEAPAAEAETPAADADAAPAAPDPEPEADAGADAPADTTDNDDTQADADAPAEAEGDDDATEK